MRESFLHAYSMFWSDLHPMFQSSAPFFPHRFPSRLSMFFRKIKIKTRVHVVLPRCSWVHTIYWSVGGFPGPHRWGKLTVLAAPSRCSFAGVGFMSPSLPLAGGFGWLDLVQDLGTLSQLLLLTRWWHPAPLTLNRLPLPRSMAEPWGRCFCEHIHHHLTLCARASSHCFSV